MERGKEEKKEGKEEELSFNLWLKNCHTQESDIQVEIRRKSYF